MPPTMRPRSIVPPAPEPVAVTMPPPAPSLGREHLTIPPSSRRRAPAGPVFLGMTVVYDTCRIPGLLVFPI